MSEEGIGQVIKAIITVAVVIGVIVGAYFIFKYVIYPWVQNLG